MRSTFNVYFFTKKDKQKANGCYPIFARITIDAVATRFYTKCDVPPNSWNAAAECAMGRSAESQKVNKILDEIRASLFTLYHDMQRRNSLVTSLKLKNEYLGNTENHQTILDLFLKHNEDVKQLVGISKTPATLQKYEVTRRHLSEFIQRKYKAPDLPIRDITPMFVNNFDLYLRTTAKCGANTTSKFMQLFKRIVIIARDNGWLQQDPFLNYKIRINQVDRGYLTQEELDRIMGKKFASKRLEQVRDIFIFSCYCGLSYIDVKNLREKHIRTSFDGNLWIMTKRQKTNISANIPLLDIPQQILAKYKGTLRNEAVLPVLSNQKMNAYLKEIGDVCGITKNLTYHLARHTFSTTVTLAKGVPIETVSKMLGHTNIRTTQIYARITDGKISHDMAILAEKLKGRALTQNQLNHESTND